MIDTHAALALQAAHVAASALRSISSLRSFLGPPSGEVRIFEDVIEELRGLYQPPRPRKPRPKSAPQLPKPRVIKKPPRVEEDEDLAPSAWDPEPVYEASRCQAFLMEIIRRAAHDYVLYRQARKMELKALAEQAYTWLFEEEPGHPAWKDRERALFKIEDEETGQPAIEVGTRRLTSFLSICEACNLDPEAVRDRAREMTVEQVTRTGRRIERRSTKSSDDSMSMETHSIVADIDIYALEAETEKSWATGGHDYSYEPRESFDSGW